jgi:hypothetical protein
MRLAEHTQGQGDLGRVDACNGLHGVRVQDIGELLERRDGDDNQLDVRDTDKRQIHLRGLHLDREPLDEQPLERDLVAHDHKRQQLDKMQVSDRAEARKGPARP